MGSSKGFALLAASIILVAGLACIYVYKAASENDDVLPDSHYTYSFTDGFVSTDVDGHEILEGFDVSGTSRIDTYFRTSDTIYGVVKFSVLSVGEYSMEREISCGWYFDDRMGDKDVPVSGKEVIETIDGEKECIVYTEDVRSLGGFGIKFFVDRDSCVIYRIITVVLGIYYDDEGNPMGIPYTTLTFDLTDYSVQKGRYMPQHPVQVAEYDAEGTYYYSYMGSVLVDIDTVGKMSITRLGTFDEGRGVAYRYVAAMSSPEVSYTLTKYVMVHDGVPIDSTPIEDGWMVNESADAYYQGYSLTQTVSNVLISHEGFLEMGNVNKIHTFIDDTEITMTILSASTK